MKKHIILLIIPFLFFGCDQSNYRKIERIKCYNAVKEIFPTALIVYDEDNCAEFIVFDNNRYKKVNVETLNYTINSIKLLKK